MKRIISLICTISLICSLLLCSTVFASPETEAIYENREESVLLQLRFIESVASDKMSRFELSEALVKMLSYEARDDGGDNPFTDITKSSTEYATLKSAYNLGILSGGDARLNDTVSYNEAVKMVICALGYDVYASYKGGYPAGYVTVANEIDLLDGVAADGEEITRDAIYTLLYNALHIDLLLTTGVGDSLNYSTIPGRNLLSDYHNITIAEGICYGVHGFSMLPSMALGRGEAYIGDILLKDSSSLSFDYVGYNTEYFYNTKTKELRAIIAKNSSYHTIASENVYDYKNNILYYDDENGKEKKANLSVSTKIVFNGAVVETFSVSDLIGINGELTLIENTGDNTVDTVIVRSLEAMVVGSVDVGGGVIYDYYDNTPLMLDLNDPDYTISFKDELGNNMELKELGRGDVITYSKSKDGKIVYAIFSNSEALGKIEAIFTEGDNTLVTIDGETYKTTKKFMDNEVVKLGISGAYRLTTDGRIAAVKLDNAAKYAYLIAGNQESGIGGRYQFKMFAREGEMIYPYLAERVNVDGETIDAKDAYSSLKSGDAIIPQLVRYELNENEELKYIDTLAKGRYESQDSLHRNFSSDYDASGNPRTQLKLTWRDIGMLGGLLPVNDTGPMFVVPQNANAGDEYYRISTPRSYFAHDHSYAVDAYKVSANELIADILVYKSDTIVKKPNDYISVVNSLTRVSHEGDEYTKLSVMTNGALKEYLIKDESVLNVKVRSTDPGYHTLVCGDVIKFATDGAGYVSVIQVWYDRKNDRFKYPEYEDTSDLTDANRVSYGEVYALVSGILQVHKGPITEEGLEFGYEELECYKTGKYTIYTYDSKERVNPLRLGGVYDIVDYKTTGEGSKVVIYTRNGFDGTMVIFK